jgi:hypothetical protein
MNKSRGKNNSHFQVRLVRPVGYLSSQNDMHLFKIYRFPGDVCLPANGPISALLQLKARSSACQDSLAAFPDLLVCCLENWPTHSFSVVKQHESRLQDSLLRRLPSKVENSADGSWTEVSLPRFAGDWC